MGLGDLAGMLKGLQQAQKQMAEMKESLERQEVEGSAGGGMVRVRSNGKGEVLEVRIEKEVVDPENVDFLEDLVRAAINQATDKAHELMQKEMAKAAGAMGLPGLGGLGGLMGNP